MNEIFKISSISQFHQILGLSAPNHPLVSLIDESNRDNNKIEIDEKFFNLRFSTEMYAIIYKDGISGSIGYGRTTYDFQESTLLFMSPGQVFEPPTREEVEWSNMGKGWTLLFHPDLLRRSTIGKKMDDYTFFSYEVNEALHLSKKEEHFVLEVVNKIKEEYSQNIDVHSQKLIISNLELLLNYCTRFYDRQFYTRTNFNQDFVTKFESKLKEYFNSDKPVDLGIPSVKYFGEELNMSSNYLSDLLKKETGKGIKDHINEAIINKAKIILLNSKSSIGEIAYDLGFEYPQSFTRLFTKKTGMSPSKYRSLN